MNYFNLCLCDVYDLFLSLSYVIVKRSKKYAKIKPVNTLTTIETSVSILRKVITKNITKAIIANDIKIHITICEYYLFI